MKVKYYDLENKRVFITGGGSGIGASIVEHFCEQGSEVYFIDIKVSEAEKLIEDIKNKKYSIPTFIECDLLNIKQLQKTIADIIDQCNCKYRIFLLDGWTRWYGCLHSCKIWGSWFN